MIHNHDTLRLKRLMDLLIITSIFAHSDFQQLINKEQPITRTVLATQEQNQVWPPQQILAPTTSLSLERINNVSS